MKQELANAIADMTDQIQRMEQRALRVGRD